MRLAIMNPNETEAKIVGPTDPGVAVEVMPLIFSKTQRVLHTVQFEVKNDSGVILDRGYITVHSRSGKLGIEHRMETLKAPVDG